MKTREMDSWVSAAMAVPLAAAAAGWSWLTLLPAAAVCMLLCTGAAHGEHASWHRPFQWMAAVLLLEESLFRAADCWQGRGASIAVPAVLLILAVCASLKGRQSAAAACNVLRYGVYAVLAALLFTGIKEVSLRNLYPRWRTGDAFAVCVLLLPAMGEPGKHRSAGLTPAVFGIAAALITTGVLGDQGSFRELGRNVFEAGSGVRMDSLAQAAMTVGYFLLLTWLCSCAGETRPGKEKEAILFCASAAAVLYLSGLRPGAPLLVLIQLAVWVALPTLQRLKTIVRKSKNNA